MGEIDRLTAEDLVRMTWSLRMGRNNLANGAKNSVQTNGSGVAKIRKISAVGADTRKKLLDAAEMLFAEYGYDGTSLRDISNEAGLHIALSTYHFGKKELLFEEVIRRRAVALEKERVSGLRAVDLSKVNSSDAVRLMLEAYCMPILKYRFGPSKQRSAYVKLLSRLFNLESWSDVLMRNYKYTTDSFMECMHFALPNADQDALVNAYSHLVASLLFICSYPDRFDEFRHEPGAKRANSDLAISELFRFNHMIFMAIKPGLPTRA